MVAIYRRVIPDLFLLYRRHITWLRNSRRYFFYWLFWPYVYLIMVSMLSERGTFLGELVCVNSLDNEEIYVVSISFAYMEGRAFRHGDIVSLWVNN
jgi:hypothetical protein